MAFDPMHFPRHNSRTYRELDMTLTQLAAGLPVDVMPGATDPASVRAATGFDSPGPPDPVACAHCPLWPSAPRF